MKSFLEEFKKFALKGNVIDLAVGVIIGAAFGKIVDSLVGDVMLPIIGVLTGGIDFSGLSLSVGNSVIAYGKFIQAAFVFTIVAFALFLLIKGVNRFKSREEAVAKPSPDVELLREIRDLLKTR